MYRPWSSKDAACAVAAALTLLAACSGKDGGGGGSAAPTRGEVFEALSSSTAPDTDGDGLPDDVERRWQAVLGTDPAKADTDGDGVNDAVELFGTAWIYVQTKGHAGKLAGGEPAARVDDPALAHGADAADSDGDGVADYLEFAGYRYEWTEARFVLDPVGFRTDPLQWSTDQDAYSDGMEASGLLMDVAVREPGSHPLVPAYPDITVELGSYTVTLNEEITYGKGNSLEKGTTWSREVTRGSSTEIGLGIETSVGMEVGLTDVSFSMETTLSSTFTTTDTQSVAVSSGGSVNEKVDWSEARTSNPTDAAHLKLYVKVRNRGTAPATNVVPTISVRIGGADVATFEPPALSVAMLMPGSSFPPDDSVHWVIDEMSPGRPLSLTDWELRALERGAPVTISVAQKRADVMRLVDGAWERVGDAGDYLGRIMSVSADLFVDVGAGPDFEEGNFIHTRVAADDRPTSPPVTLGEALAWSMGFRLNDDGRYSVELPHLDGTTETVVLRGTVDDDREWRWQVDPVTIARNFTVPPVELTADQMLAMRLGPTSRVSLRAPRQLKERGPYIHSASAYPRGDVWLVSTCVSDYDGVARVKFVDEGGVETELFNDGRGPWFFSGAVPGPLAGESREWIVAESRRTEEVEDPANPGSVIVRPLTHRDPVRLVVPPTPSPAKIGTVEFTVGTNRLYARVEPGGPLGAMDEIDWVRVYHPSYTTAPVGYLELKRVNTWWEDPHGFEVLAIPGGWQAGLRLVAYTKGFQVTILPLDSANDQKAFKSGGTVLGAAFDYTATDWWWVPQTDLERDGPPVYGYQVEADWFHGEPATLNADWKWWVTGGNPAAWTTAHGLPDVYLRSSQYDYRLYWLAFHVAAAKAPTSGEAYYQTVTRRTVKVYEPLFLTQPPTPGYGAPLFDVQPGEVYFFKTTEGRYGKLIIRARTADYSWWGDSSWQNVWFDYTVYGTDP
jgi:hypothetical protein